MMEKRKISKLVCLLVMMLAIAAPCHTHGQYLAVTGGKEMLNNIAKGNFKRILDRIFQTASSNEALTYYIGVEPMEMTHKVAEICRPWETSKENTSYSGNLDYYQIYIPEQLNNDDVLECSILPIDSCNRDDKDLILALAQDSLMNSNFLFVSKSEEKKKRDSLMYQALSEIKHGMEDYMKTSCDSVHQNELFDRLLSSIDTLLERKTDTAHLKNDLNRVISLANRSLRFLDDQDIKIMISENIRCLSFVDQIMPSSKIPMPKDVLKIAQEWFGIKLENIAGTIGD